MKRSRRPVARRYGPTQRGGAGRGGARSALSDEAPELPTAVGRAREERDVLGPRRGRADGSVLRRGGRGRRVRSRLRGRRLHGQFLQVMARTL